MLGEWTAPALFIIEGAKVTLEFTIISLFCGAPLAIPLAAAKISKSKLIQCLANAYTTLFRGTPLLVQLGLFYYGLPQITGYAISTFEAGILTFALNSAAYSSEIIRAGIQSIDEGQWQAGHVLGLSTFQTFVYIILPQALRNILPALMNEMVDLLKETSLIATLASTADQLDIMRRAQIIAGQTYLYFQPLCIAALCYFVLVWTFGWCAKRLEKRWAQ